MRHVLRWLAAIAVLATLLLGNAADAQKKDKDKDKDKDVTTEKMIKSGVLVGKVMAVYEDKRTVRLQVAVSVAKLNAGSVQQLAQAKLDLANAAARGDRNGVMSARQSIVQAQATLYNIEKHHQDVELQALDDALVRTAFPRTEFDEKGKTKKLTAKQLKELKGPDPKQPGYKAEFGDVAVDQILQVTLVKKKPTGPAAKVKPPAKKTKAKGKDKDDDEPVDVLAGNLPQVSMIMILVDPPPSGG